MSEGYLYVLINYSMKDLVKIGMTTREPEDRVQELSQATGVPTPFVLVYKEHFNDCIAAEQKVHIALDGYRVSAGREFFDIPVYNAIKLIQSLKNSEEEKTTKVDDNRFVELQSFNHLGEEIYEEGDSYYYGQGEQIQDYDEALRLYEKAAKLGYAKAYIKLGKMYELGEGVISNDKKALVYYKEAVKAGHTKGNGPMALLFSNSRSNLYNLENSVKCWDNYFGYIKEQGIEFADHFYIYDYLHRSIQNETEVGYIEVLSIYQNEILNTIEYQIENYQDIYPALIREKKKVRNVVENNFIVDIDMINDFSGRVRDLFGYKGNAVILVEIISGMITEGDIITVEKGRTIKQATIELIDVDGDFVSQAGAKNKEVSLVLKDIPQHEFNSLGSGATVFISADS